MKSLRPLYTCEEELLQTMGLQWERASIRSFNEIQLWLAKVLAELLGSQLVKPRWRLN